MVWRENAVPGGAYASEVHLNRQVSGPHTSSRASNGDVLLRGRTDHWRRVQRIRR